jgi:hypothetical protein
MNPKSSGGIVPQFLDYGTEDLLHGYDRQGGKLALCASIKYNAGVKPPLEVGP